MTSSMLTLKRFKLTFKPMAKAPKNIFELSYIVDANELAEAERTAEAFLRSEDYNRSHFKKNIASSFVEVTDEDADITVTDTADTETTVIKEEVHVQLTEQDDPFAGFMTQCHWTVDSLNARLELLKLGEKLIIDDLPDTTYHAVIGVSCSKLKLFIECPQKYKAKYIDGLIPQSEKSYFDMGKAIHTVVLEPWLFDSSYVRQPDSIKRRAGNDWKAVKADADEAGQIVLTQDQWDDMPILRQSLKSNPTAKALSTGGVAERSIFKRDKTGLIIKCRPDYQIDDLIVDLKSDASADPRFFGAKAKKLGYHIQDALYTDVSGANEFVFFVIESSRPFVITAPVVFNVKTKRLGYLKYRKAMRELAQCMESNIWPAYTNEAVMVSLNNWELDELEQLEAENNMEHAA
ncbi:PD-(D/E)XK nuclease-like domain-containing protein [Shewanella sp. D64]|uniref:PD-(D/E)XK nuclease-like domain-containing protein n=1 Tax=unclassified Shewanella TaxID=196818 RepID=UPI0022BA4BBC|nr:MULTISPECIES: PD-(D/E)XK nuclease-like domain-containing protein [unclassified Shewanella]MEC4724290.1 PD-(D/E)XK nuclease-like domain-containing protein [Shewanella sp. D64]MEC4738802.1 PD-(D/E)XK nuclease-like domain-containing protein [Shewanella sp. E94]WBJ97759.1 PD-(D/E)XK nuclease-like domain-containing protein [Shewanella sp. MTB7]